MLFQNINFFKDFRQYNNKFELEPPLFEIFDEYKDMMEKHEQQRLQIVRNLLRLISQMSKTDNVKGFLKWRTMTQKHSSNQKN